MPRSATTQIVQKRLRSGTKTKIVLDNGVIHSLRPFAPIGEGDKVVVRRDSLLVQLEKDAGLVEIEPAWRQRRTFKVGDKGLSVTMKEVETEQEYEELKRLQSFHYRGNSTGRTLPLIAVTTDPTLPRVIGFVEITSALLVNTARTSVLNRPFSDKDSGAVWQRWDMATAKKNTRRIARISRCVVYPELRGLGLSTHLVGAAIEFAKARWHYGGAKAIFLEITADMLRYIPFVKSAGFHFVGNTEGNEDRVLRDMRYLIGRSMKSKTGRDYPAGGGGIMDLQRSYATTLHEVMKERKLNLETLLNLLRRDPSHLSDDEWIALHRVFRHPKPTYMAGLTAAADKLLTTLEPRHNRAINPRFTSKPDQARKVLSVGELTVSVLSNPSRSSRSRKVAEAFGVVSKDASTDLIKKLSLSVDAGQIILISGPSGSGKSLLLKTLVQLAATNGKEIGDSTAKVSLSTWSGTPKIAWLEAARSDSAAVDLLEHLPLDEALSILAAAGLAEAPLFVKPTKFFSDGQMYRLAIALALSKQPDLILADAFCEPLDYFSAATVCKRLRRFCKERGIALVAATADAGRVQTLLKPDQFLQIMPGRTHSVSQ